MGLRWGPRGVRFLISEVPLHHSSSNFHRLFRFEVNHRGHQMAELDSTMDISAKCRTALKAALAEHVAAGKA